MPYIVTYHSGADGINSDAFLVGAFSTLESARNAIVEDFNNMKESCSANYNSNFDTDSTLDFSHFPLNSMESVKYSVVPIVVNEFDGLKSFKGGSYNITQAELDWLIEPKDQPFI
jgi:hypothetical protein